MRQCPNCKTEVSFNAVFCSNCGKKIDSKRGVVWPGVVEVKVVDNAYLEGFKHACFGNEDVEGMTVAAVRYALFRWATIKQRQAVIRVYGLHRTEKQDKTLPEVAREMGIPADALRSAISSYFWSLRTRFPKLLLVLKGEIEPGEEGGPLGSYRKYR